MTVTRFRAGVVRRPSLPLTAQDEADLDRLRRSPLELESLARLSAEPVGDRDVSESALLHAVFAAGLAATRAASEEAGYAQLAIEIADDEGHHRASARRRRPSWASEE